MECTSDGTYERWSIREMERLSDRAFQRWSVRAMECTSNGAYKRWSIQAMEGTKKWNKSRGYLTVCTTLYTVTDIFCCPITNDEKVFYCGGLAMVCGLPCCIGYTSKVLCNYLWPYSSSSVGQTMQHDCLSARLLSTSQH